MTTTAMNIGVAEQQTRQGVGLLFAVAAGKTGQALVGHVREPLETMGATILRS
ncbi:MAG: hypothetical protein ABSB75_00760 [Candidatus Limnocylindrales bacterium]